MRVVEDAAEEDEEEKEEKRLVRECVRISVTVRRATQQVRPNQIASAPRTPTTITCRL